MSDAVKYRIFYLSIIYQRFSSLKPIINKRCKIFWKFKVYKVFWIVYFVIQQNLIENLQTKYMNINVCEPRYSSYHLALIVTTSVSKWREILSGISLLSHTCKYKRIIIYHPWPPIRLIHYLRDTKINLTVSMVYLVQLFIHSLVKLQRVSSF